MRPYPIFPTQKSEGLLGWLVQEDSVSAQSFQDWTWFSLKKSFYHTKWSPGNKGPFLRADLHIELSKPMKYFFKWNKKIFEAFCVYQGVVYSDENTNVQLILKDFHHTCLESTSTVSTSLNQLARVKTPSSVKKEYISWLFHTEKTARIPWRRSSLQELAEILALVAPENWLICNPESS